MITTVVYLPIFNVFFQHEEWSAFGRIFALRSGDFKFTILSYLSPNVAHYVPLARLLSFIYILLFKLNSNLFAIESLFFHLVVSSLSFILFRRVLKNHYLALFATTFFALNASSHQATTWLVADINTHMSTLFALGSLIFALSTNRRWLSLVFLLTALLFKETPIGLFAFLPTLVLLFGNINHKKDRIFLFQILCFSALYIVLRALMISSSRMHIDDRLVTETQSIYEILVNFLTFPAKVLAQTLIPTRLLLSWARSLGHLLPMAITGAKGTTAFDLFVEGTGLQVVNYSLFVFLTAPVLFLTKLRIDPSTKKNLIFGLSFVFFNSR